MLTALAALTTLAVPTMSVVEIHPTDDVWAYPHAADQDSDPFLRVWGFEGQNVARSADESESFGYSLLKFDLAGVPTKALKGATLVVTHTPKPAFTLEMAKQNPLEVRPVNADFTEKKWVYGDLSKYMPAAGKEGVFGTGWPAAISDEKEFPIAIDLMKGPNAFSKAFELARTKGALAIALTTTLSPNEEARSVYKLYSKDGPKEMRPILRLELED